MYCVTARAKRRRWFENPSERASIPAECSASFPDLLRRLTDTGRVTCSPRGRRQQAEREKFLALPVPETFADCGEKFSIQGLLKSPTLYSRRFRFHGAARKPARAHEARPPSASIVENSAPTLLRRLHGPGEPLRAVINYAPRLLDRFRPGPRSIRRWSARASFLARALRKLSPRRSSLESRSCRSPNVVLAF